MTRRKSRRSRNLRERTQLSIISGPFRQVRNPWPPLELIAEEQVDQLHAASMEILENVGLDFYDDEALELWEKAGAKVDRSARHVWLDRGLIAEAVAKAPAQFTWRARNPAHNLVVGGSHITFAPQGGVAYVTDLEHGRRSGTLQDYENFIKLSQVAGVLHFAGEQLIVPYEVPPSLRHLRRLRYTFTLSDKAAMEAAHGREISADNVNMARIVFGDPLPPEPVIGGVINVNSPLRYDERMLGGLITYARAGQVNVVTPFILAGAMSPITIAAALAQQNAEALAGVALVQLVNPGCPVLYGGFTTNVDMKSGSPAFGTPEGAWAMSVGAQLARRYGLPYRGSGSLNTSKTPDAQAAYETMWTLWPAIHSHTNFIFHAVGWLEAGLTVSYEKFVIDLELLAMFQHYLAGFKINDDTLALDMIARVGPGGHHFGTPHTQARFSDEFYEPFLSDRLGFEPWQAAGSWDAARRASNIWKKMIAHYEQPALDEGVRDELADYVARRERELEGVTLYR